jgi:2',3'-cyclic-nucleotide 2'-phosphodiesterase (5'-nucleotidase family)
MRVASTLALCAALVVATLASCSDDETPVGPGSGGSSGGNGGSGGAGAGGATTTTVTLFHTNDEHGWLQADGKSTPALVQGGPANLRAWLDAEGYAPSEHLLLSAGDTFAGGPAISVWFEGEPTVEVMNLMGYAAAAIGNHEFDFGVDVLLQRVQQAQYPYLSANIIEDSTGDPPAFAVPFVVLERQGVQVGVVGLTTTSSYTSTHPKFVEGLTFTDYVSTLNEQVPLARAAGAEIVVALAHECAPTIASAIEASSIQVDVALSGHCHEVASVDASGIPVLSSDSSFHGYARVDIEVDSTTHEVLGIAHAYTPVSYVATGSNPVTPDAQIQAVVDGWQQQTDAALGATVGHTETGLPLASWKTANWVVDAWLASYPQADVAVTNFGTFREPIAPGDFTLEAMVGLLPFINTLVTIQLTGAELELVLRDRVHNCLPLQGCGPAVGGMTFVDQGADLAITLMGAVPFDPATTYTVLITDYLYYGGAGYDFASYDPAPIEVATHFRDPVVSWTQALQTSASDPLENYIDSVPRNQ